MTMHLAQGLTTINTRKRKAKKLTQSKLDQLEVQWRQHNKDMRRKNLHDLQFKNFDDFVAYIQGRYKFPSRKESFKPYVQEKTFRRETPDIPSLGMGIGVATKKESQKYTGTLIKGIATMHKSNAVPIINEQQAKDISSMRR